ncbi:hypothetical protein ABMB68_006338 [Bradyrhizobium sp. RT4a]
MKALADKRMGEARKPGKQQTGPGGGVEKHLEVTGSRAAAHGTCY